MKMREKANASPCSNASTERRTPFAAYSECATKRERNPYIARVYEGTKREWSYVARCPSAEAARLTARAFVAVSEAAPEADERAARCSARRLADDAGVGQLHLPLADDWPAPDAV